jgi:hypothetical protein
MIPRKTKNPLNNGNVFVCVERVDADINKIWNGWMQVPVLILSNFTPQISVNADKIKFVRTSL